MTDLGNTKETLETTSHELHFFTFDNLLNPAITYLKFYNNATPTVGTTDPDIVVACPASVKGSVSVPDGLTGIFTTACSVVAVTTGGTGGTTAPTNAFNCSVGLDTP